MLLKWELHRSLSRYRVMRPWSGPQDVPLNKAPGFSFLVLGMEQEAPTLFSNLTRSEVTEQPRKAEVWGKLPRAGGDVELCPTLQLRVLEEGSCKARDRRFLSPEQHGAEPREP